MNNNLIQTELDMAEEHIISCLFGDVNNPQVNSTIRSFLALQGKSVAGVINEYIDKFEAIIKPMLKENGFIDGAKFSKLVKIKFNQDINIQDFRIIELTRILEPWLLDISKLIQ